MFIVDFLNSEVDAVTCAIIAIVPVLAVVAWILWDAPKHVS